MEFKLRKQVEFVAVNQSDSETCINTCFPYCIITSCFQNCPFLCPTSSDYFPPPIPFDARHEPSRQARIAIGCILSALVFALVYCCVFCNKEGDWSTRNRMSHGARPPQPDREEIEDNPRQDVENPAWLIATVGMPMEIINKIASYKYRKQPDVVEEGMDCSVCLGDFQEDETLRQLPNCRHAFHIQCIDTWLKSHTSCPLCRSKIELNLDSNSK
uniref:RING-type E3 ubiquitin transferase n=1 Tax=Kalanchoe fedtschenkoi TaxID=63787 RepID=A0A7N1A385_KALFE